MARRLAHQGVVGFEWAVGVPGTVGGAVAMNAGGHGDDVAGSIVEATVWRDGEVRTWSKEQLRAGLSHECAGRHVTWFSRRASPCRAGTRRAPKSGFARSCAGAVNINPVAQNAGSVFRNPDGDHAARLIEEAGCKGLRLGSAIVSEKHANFIQADAGGLAIDVYSLINLVTERVLEASGVELVCENRFVGFGVSP